MDQYLSDKIKVISFICILLVLYIHSTYGIEVFPEGSLYYYIQNMISRMLGRCAVPLFFMISGYLFFLHTSHGLSSILQKMKKRIRTLLIPYITASLIILLINIIVSVTPGISSFVNNPIFPLLEKGCFRVFYAVLFNDGSGLPTAFHLWFLRDLIILVLFSPIWYFLLKYLKWYWIPIVFILDFFSFNYFPVYALSWFSLGAALVKTDVTKERPFLGSVTILIYIALCLMQLFYPTMELWDKCVIPITLLGVISYWYFYGVIVSRSFSLQKHIWLAKACSYTFFIYLFHLPLLNIFRKLIVLIGGNNQTGYFISYFISPPIFIFFAVLLGMCLKKYVPAFYKTIAGNR